MTCYTCPAPATVELQLRMEAKEGVRTIGRIRCCEPCMASLERVDDGTTMFRMGPPPDAREGGDA